VSDTQSLSHRTAQGLKWSYGATALQVGLVLLMTSVLARLVTPAQYGLVAAASVVMGFGQYFAQLGLGQALVQRATIDDRDIRVAFESALCLGIIFYGGCWLIAPWIARLFRDPAIVPTLRVLGLVFVGNALSVTSSALLRRHLRIRALTIADISSFAFGYAATALILAALGAGSWSLVAGYVAQSFLAATLYYAAARHPIKPVWDRAVIKRLYGFGSRVSVISFLEFLCNNLDSLWTARVLGTVRLGFYNRAYNLVSVPVFYTWSSFTKVTVSSFSRIQRERERMRGVFVPVLMVFMAMACPVFWGLAGASHDLVLVLLGSRWLPTAAPVAVLALAAPLWLAACVSGMVCEATAHLRAKLCIAGSQAALLALLLVSLGRHSIVGVAAAIALSESWAFAWYIFTVSRVLRCRVTSLRGPIVPGATAGVLTGGACLALSFAQTAGAIPALAALAAQVACSVVLASLVLLRGFHGRVWEDARAVLRPNLQDRATVASRVVITLDKLAAHRVTDE
jgi:lipopolysaccharide exporter